MPVSIDTLTLISNTFDPNPNPNTNYAFCYNATGTLMFILDSASPATIYQWFLREPYDSDSAIYVKSLDLSTVNAAVDSVSALAVSNDGTKLYLADAFDILYEFTFGTVGDIGTLTDSGRTFDYSADESFPVGMVVNPDGTKLYMCGTSNPSFPPIWRVLQYSMTGGKVDTLTLDGSYDYTGESSAAGAGLAWSRFGNTLILNLFDGANRKLQTYSPATPWDITSGLTVGASKTTSNNHYMTLAHDDSRLITMVINSVFSDYSLGPTAATVDAPIDNTTLKAETSIRTSWEYGNVLDIGPTQNNGSHELKKKLTDGTGENEGKKTWNDQRVASAASTADEIALSGVLLDAWGNTLSFTSIKRLVISNLGVPDGSGGFTPTDGEDLLVGGATNGISSIFDGDASKKIVVPSGGCLVLFAPLNGYAVSAGTADILRFEHDGTTDFEFKVEITGVVS